MSDVRKDRPRPNKQKPNKHRGPPDLHANNKTADGQIYKPTHSQTDKQTDKQIDGQTSTLKNPYQQNIVIANPTVNAPPPSAPPIDDEEYKFGNLLGYFKSMDQKWENTDSIADMR